MRLFTVFLTTLFILAACAAPAQPTVIPEKITTPESHTVVTDGTFGTSLLATLWKNSSEGSVLFPVDPATGTALTGYTPISLGRVSFPAFSPDRHTLAVVSFPNDNADHGSLLLIDLPTWKTQRFELGLTGWVNSLVFGPDGKQLAMAQVESHSTITVIDAKRGIITAQSQVASFVTRLKFTKSGEALMAYGPTPQSAADGLSASPPQVMLLDATDLDPHWSAELKEVRDGLFPKDKTITKPQLYEPGNGFYLSPGLAFAPDQDILYIAHADSEKLTKVDFGDQKVETVDIQPKLSWLGRLLSLTAGVAHAKGEDGTSKQAVISPDGQLLYVVGVQNASSLNQGELEIERTPLGLEIIQTHDGSRVAHLETDASELSLSPDGRFLYMRNGENRTPWTEIFDTSTRRVIAHKEALYATPALLVNGQFLLASTYSTSETSNHMSVLQPDGSGVLANWTGEDYISWLTTP